MLASYHAHANFTSRQDYGGTARSDATTDPSARGAKQPSKKKSEGQDKERVGSDQVSPTARTLRFNLVLCTG